MVWERSTTINYPKTWIHFEDKASRKFSVKDLTSEYYDIALGFMTNMFLTESLICKPLKILEDPVARKQMQDKWLNIMKANMALICICHGDVPRVAGIHLTLVREKNNNAQKKKSSETQYSKFTKVVEDLKDEGQMFEKFGVDHYLGSLGLFVLPEFRGLGIATHMLKARIKMCKELGLKGTATVFSTPGAQAAAASAGYDVIAVRTKDQVAHILNLEYTLAVMGTKC